MRNLPQWEFDFYALSLPRGHGFGDEPAVAAWASTDNNSCGIVTQQVNTSTFSITIMRRRSDLVWTITQKQTGFVSVGAATSAIERYLASGLPLETMPAGTSPRPPLFDTGSRQPSDVFRLLSTKTHEPAAWALHQLYLALPRPDRNWASDCQTKHFHTRIWEAHLLGSFREQGLLVEQPFESPDFRITGRHGESAWIEAVTANPVIPTCTDYDG